VDRLYKGTRISVIAGDITQLEVDAIVNPANSQLLMGGRVAGAILKAAGDRIQNEALTKAPISIGKAVITAGGKLKAKHVIHAPTMTRPAMPTSRENVRLATSAALDCARRLGIKNIAFPGLGTGVGGFDPNKAGKIMVEEIKKHIELGTSIERVILVGFSPQLTQAFENEVKTLR